MNLIALELPDNVSDWPPWLERQVVGLQLRELVMQLEVIGEESKKDALLGNDWNERLANVLGTHQSDVMQSGLSVLSEDQLRTLVQSPRLLMALQELVFIDGGEHWRYVSRTGEHQEQAVAVRERVMALVESISMRKVAMSGAEPISRRDNRRSIAMVAVGIAASVLLGVFIWQNRQSEGKFFARRGLLESNTTGHEFLVQISAAIRQDWQSGNDEAAFSTKLTELRDSCDVLLVADLHQLDPAIAADLKQRCRGWRDKLTGQLVDLASGKPIAEVRQSADATVNRLIEVIQGMT